MNVILITYIAVPLIAAALMMPLSRLGGKIPELLSVLVTLYLLLQTIALYSWRPYNFVILYYPLTLDGLSHLLLLAVSLTTFAVSFYSVQYMKKYTGRDKYYTLYMLLLTGMCGVILAGDLVSLFIFMEVAAISTYALVAFGLGPEELEASLKYLIIGAVASLLILFGISLIYGLTGTFNLAQIARTFPPSAVYAKGFITALFLAGFGMKAALMPFHAWLPDAHTAAPAPISATLSGVLIKALGIYVMIRLFYNILGMTPQLSFILTFLGVASILAGALLALTQNDFKRLLAYSSIEQVGFIVVGFSLGTPLGLMGALFHLFNHAIFKPLLFMNAGSVETATGTRQLDQLGGLGRKMPLTSLTNLVGSLSISGLPPFNGFWSKLFIIIACVQSGRFWTAGAAVLGAVITLANFTRLYKLAFTGHLPDHLHKVKESPWMMSTAVCSLALLCLAVGLAFPLIISNVINPAVVAVANGTGYGRMIAGVK
jgi:multicomponent Na+:H+ antiporter subunit D